MPDRMSKQDEGGAVEADESNAKGSVLWSLTIRKGARLVGLAPDEKTVMYRRTVRAVHDGVVFFEENEVPTGCALSLVVAQHGWRWEREDDA